MATMTEEQIETVVAAIEEELNISRESLAIVRTALTAFVEDVDAWIHHNAASFNHALRQPAQDALTAKQKNRGFRRVAKARELLEL